MTETVTIPKEEYLRLKKLEKVDYKLLNQITNSFKDIKEGKIRKVA